MGIAVRFFEYKDAIEISRLIVKNLEEETSKAYDRKTVETLINKNTAEMVLRKSEIREFYVAEQNRQIIGVVSLEDNFIKDLFVRPDLHNKGIGKLLIEHAEKVFKERGFDKAIAFSSLTAVEFYNKLGFREKEHVFSTVDDIVLETVRMEKELDL